MKKRYLIIGLLTVLPSIWLSSQIIDGKDTLFGNEWIHFDQVYYKLKINQDGIYRMDYSTLATAGFPVNEIRANELQLFCLGQEQPLYTSTEEVLKEGDYLEFYGQANRSQLDRFLFLEPDSTMLNPDYSLITDTAVYFLTYSPGPHLRYQSLPEPLPSFDTLDWYWHEEKISFSEAHFKPTINDEGVRLSEYVPGEGFGTAAFQNRSVSIPATNPVFNQHKPRMSFRLSGRNAEHTFSVAYNQTPPQDFNAPSRLVNQELILPQISSENKFLFNTPNANDRLVLGTISLSYPRQAVFSKLNGFNFSLPDFYPRSTVAIQAPGTGYLVVYDPESFYRHVVDNHEGTYYVDLKQAKSKLILSQESTPIHHLQKVEFHELDLTGADYVFITAHNFQAETQMYRDYRQSEAGGGFNTQILFAEDLYDQFSYGIPFHPLSIKNWANYAASNYPQVKYALLIGKGYQYSDIRKSSNKGYLPVFGLPGSQQMLLSSGSSTVPHFAHGLLSATSGQDILNYLTKIKDMEQLLRHAPQTIEDRAWMKRVLHMAAGNDALETELLMSFLNNMGEILTHNSFGANITRYSKQANSEIVDRGINEQIFDLINSGIAIKTYFGHGNSSITLLDSYEHPGIFENYQRYPLMLSLGCFTGNAFLNGQSLSEENIMYPQKGAVGYLATSGQGYISTLSEFGNDFYNSLGHDFFSNNVGQILKNYLAKNEEVNFIPIKIFQQQLIYQGDPVYRLNYSTAPDFVVNYASIKATQKEDPNKIDLRFDIYNLGASVQDSLELLVIHTYPQSRDEEIYTFKILSSGERNEISLQLNSRAEQGQHDFKIIVNPQGIIPEGPQPAAHENNTTREFTFFILDNRALPSYPPEFAIINQLPIQLIATTANAFAETQKYEFEIDTTNSFSKSILRFVSDTIRSPISWNVNQLPWQDQVYYWRVKPIDAGNEYWQTSSFLYAPALSSGWNQSHWNQWERNTFTGMRVTQGKFEFEPQSTHISIRNKINQPAGRSTVNINGTPWFEAHDERNFPSLAVTVFDLNGHFFKNKVGENLNQYTRAITTHYFYTKTADERKACIDFIGSLPTGYTILLYPIRDNIKNDFQALAWAQDSLIYNENIYSYLETQGAQKIRNINQGNQLKPYVFIFKKDQGAILEELGNSLEDIVLVDYLVPVSGEKGNFLTQHIGPTSQWQTLDWKAVNSDDQHKPILEIFDGNYFLLDSAIMRLTSTGKFSLDTLNTLNIRTINIKYLTSDTINFKPQDLEYLRVFFEPGPDLVLDASEKFNFHDQEINRGDSVSISFYVRNLGSDILDSFVVQIKTRDQQNQEVNYSTKCPPLIKDDKKLIQYKFPTRLLQSPGLLTVQINPDQHIRETNYSNNIGSISFDIIDDTKRPVLDVTFDGLHIKTNEQISSTPEIRIQLSDENNIYPINLDNLKLELTNPAGARREINWTEENIAVEYIGLAKGGSSLGIQWYPKFESSGRYVLMVNGYDVQGNLASGEREFRFTVLINSDLFIQVSPNPFSNIVYFKHNLREIEAQFESLEILDQRGIKIEEIRIGQNSNNNSLTWTGNNNSKLPLPAGIYIYRLIYQTKLGEKKIKLGKLVFIK